MRVDEKRTFIYIEFQLNGLVIVDFFFKSNCLFKGSFAMANSSNLCSRFATPAIMWSIRPWNILLSIALYASTASKGVLYEINAKPLLWLVLLSSTRWTWQVKILVIAQVRVSNVNVVVTIETFRYYLLLWRHHLQEHKMSLSCLSSFCELLHVIFIL